MILQSLNKVISRYEKRLEKIRIQLNISQEELPHAASDARVKRRLDITITGTVAATNESITYRDNFFISPLAYN